ncbi:hypothetical protein C8R44DRAFT_747263 [Mycena epipterygia]|nr:hypothetical protein C8R44DRAFT_747263 [Mycena epipterygia]
MPFFLSLYFLQLSVPPVLSGPMVLLGVLPSIYRRRCGPSELGKSWRTNLYTCAPDVWVIPYCLSSTSASLSLPLTPVPPPIMSASRSCLQLTLHHVVIAPCIMSGCRTSKGVAQAVIVLPSFPPNSLSSTYSLCE